MRKLIVNRLPSIDQKSLPWSQIFVLAGCLLLCFILYAPALDAYFVAEDLRSLHFGWQDVLAEFSGFGQSVGFRPGTILYFAINNALWGRNPIGHHAVVLVLHAMVGWLAYLITQRVTGHTESAMAVSVLFLATPAHTEAVVWLAASAGTVTSGLLCMFAAWLWIKGRDERKPIITIFVAILYLLALLIKEVALPLPGLLLLLDLATGRVSASNGAKRTSKTLLAYWPLAIALSLYGILHYLAGVWTSSIHYGLHLDMSFSQIVSLWTAYARDLFQPVSSFIEWKIGVKSWIWLGMFLVLLHAFHPARWAFLWVILALAPAATAYGERLTYLALVGFSMGLVISLSTLIRLLAYWINREKLRSARISGLVMLSIVLVILVADFRAVRRDIPNWVEAGRLTWSIPRQAKKLLPNPPSGAELYFIDLPDNVNGAYVYRWGIVPEVKYVYSDTNIDVHHVVEYPRGGKTDLASIECQSEASRFFFQYDRELGELKQVSKREFGLDCSPPDN
jgi:protein O-mannosyl-transferase